MASEKKEAQVLQLPACLTFGQQIVTWEGWVGSLLIDLCAAFDTLQIKLLIDKLKILNRKAQDPILNVPFYFLSQCTILLSSDLYCT